MTIVGRITRDASVKELQDKRKVVHFSVAVNDFYKPKNGEAVKTTTFVNCSYWLHTQLADQLKKGSLVEVTGRIYVTAYTDANGLAKASLNCHVQRLKVHQWSRELTLLGAAKTEDAQSDEPPF